MSSSSSTSSATSSPSILQRPAILRHIFKYVIRPQRPVSLRRLLPVCSDWHDSVFHFNEVTIRRCLWGGDSAENLRLKFSDIVYCFHAVCTCWNDWYAKAKKEFEKSKEQNSSSTSFQDINSFFTRQKYRRELYLFLLVDLIKLWTIDLKCDMGQLVHPATFLRKRRGTDVKRLLTKRATQADLFRWPVVPAGQLDEDGEPKPYEKFRSFPVSHTSQFLNATPVREAVVCGNRDLLQFLLDDVVQTLARESEEGKIFDKQTPTLQAAITKDCDTECIKALCRAFMKEHSVQQHNPKNFFYQYAHSSAATALHAATFCIFDQSGLLYRYSRLSESADTFVVACVVHRLHDLLHFFLTECKCSPNKIYQSSRTPLRYAFQNLDHKSIEMLATSPFSVSSLANDEEKDAADENDKNNNNEQRLKLGNNVNSSSSDNYFKTLLLEQNTSFQFHTQHQQNHLKYQKDIAVAKCQAIPADSSPRGNCSYLDHSPTSAVANSSHSYYLTPHKSSRIFHPPCESNISDGEKEAEKVFLDKDKTIRCEKREHDLAITKIFKLLCQLEIEKKDFDKGKLQFWSYLLRDSESFLRLVSIDNVPAVEFLLEKFDRGLFRRNGRRTLDIKKGTFMLAYYAAAENCSFEMLEVFHKFFHFFEDDGVNEKFAANFIFGASPEKSHVVSTSAADEENNNDDDENNNSNNNETSWSKTVQTIRNKFGSSSNSNNKIALSTAHLDIHPLPAELETEHANLTDDPKKSTFGSALLNRMITVLNRAVSSTILTEYIRRQSALVENILGIHDAIWILQEVRAESERKNDEKDDPEESSSKNTRLYNFLNIGAACSSTSPRCNNRNDNNINRLSTVSIAFDLARSKGLHMIAYEIFKMNSILTSPQQQQQSNQDHYRSTPRVALGTPTQQRCALPAINYDLIMKQASPVTTNNTEQENSAPAKTKKRPSYSSLLRKNIGNNDDDEDNNELDWDSFNNI